MFQCPQIELKKVLQFHFNSEAVCNFVAILFSDWEKSLIVCAKVETAKMSPFGNSTKS